MFDILTKVKNASSSTRVYLSYVIFFPQISQNKEYIKYKKGKPT